MNNLSVTTVSDSKACDLAQEGFKVYEISKGSTTPSYDRKNYYKICLITGKNIIHFADRRMEANGTVLFFGNPNVLYSWETVTEDQRGHACVFTEDYFSINDRFHSLSQFSFFKIEGTPLFYLNHSQQQFIESVFHKMMSVQRSDYVYRDDLIRDYIRLILHEAQRILPPDPYTISSGASFRIAGLFLELLEKQFPIERKDQRLQAKYPKDFANHLSIHVNHLNYTIREVTGKSTTKHISDRIAMEAKALLKNTDWTIADISYSLGFEYPTHFTNYFKRITGTTPKSMRDKSLNVSNVK